MASEYHSGEVVQAPSNWAGTKLGSLAAFMIIGVEASPLPINEGLRVAAGAWGYHASDGNSFTAMIAAGAATVAIEGGAAIAAADLLDSPIGQKATAYVRDKMAKIGIKDGIKTNFTVNVATAFLGGSAVVTAVKHQQEPARTRLMNRQYGLRSAGGLTVFTMAETYAVASGLEHPNPTSIALGALAIGGFFGAVKWAKNKLKDGEQLTHTAANEGNTPHLVTPTVDEVQEALAHPKTLVVKDGGKTMPVLMPVENSRWYNVTYLRERYGTDDLYVYMYPAVNDAAARQDMYENIRDIVQAGGVVLYGAERVADTVYGDLSAELVDANIEHTKLSAAPEGQERFLPQYDGLFTVRGRGRERFKEVPRLHDVYLQAVAEGRIKFDANEGPALADIITGLDADRLWKIYQKPFAKLSQSHPITVGYSEEEFREMLADDETVKAVYRQNGRIVTMAFFVNNLDHCDWLDKSYYAQKYPEATATKNHWVFPGIVTDEKKRGERLSIPLLTLVAKVQALTKSPAIISFECTEVSSKYIPKIAAMAIRRSMVAKTAGFKQVSRLDHYAITQ